MTRLAPGAPTTLDTDRLRLRPPRTDDAAFHHALHSDPATHAHAPWEVVHDPAQNRLTLTMWLEHWANEGFGYWIVEDRSGRAVGMAGVRRLDGEPGLNLAVRLLPGAHGQGLGREAVRAVVTWAAQWLPGEDVVAVVRPENTPSERAVAAAGLSRVAAVAHAGAPADTGPSNLWRTPTLAVVGADDAPREEMLDMWCAVNAAGGSVGFLPDAPRDAVARVLDRHLDVTGPDAPLVTLRDAADAALLGFCWWVRDPFELMAHTVVLKRFMVAPRRQGSNLGALLLAGSLAVARDMPDVDLLRLDYRSGSGLGAFYARHGFVETGRVPGLIRIGPGRRRDSVSMARTPSGAPLVFDGRL